MTLTLTELTALQDLHLSLSGPLRSPADVDRSRRALTSADRAGLEDALVGELDQEAWKRPDLHHALRGDPRATADDVVRQLRGMAARHRLPEVYRWVAREADREQVVGFLHLEGGPDHGFDDLVAACQVGLPTGPKVELARNYWDEMGHGSTAATHSELWDDLLDEIGGAHPGTPSAPALRRSLLMSLLANRHDLQATMLGALGMVELQAGPRCELVLQGMARVGLSSRAQEFYAVHAHVDPTHGRDWLDNAIAPSVQAQPWMAGPVLRGAAWRCATDDAFFAELAGQLLPAGALAA